MKIEKQVGHISYDLDGLTISEAIETLKNIETSYKAQSKEYEDFIIKYQDKQWDEGQELAVYGRREENKEEKAKRKNEEDLIKTNRTNYERQQYEQLKKKFEN